jgi:hypothetical protein
LGLDDLQGAEADAYRARLREVTEMVMQRIAQLEAIIEARLGALPEGKEGEQFRALLKRLKGTREALRP